VYEGHVSVPVLLQDGHERRRRDHGELTLRAAPHTDVPAQAPGQELGSEHQLRLSVEQHEGSVREIVRVCEVETTLARHEVEPLRVQPRVDGVGAAGLSEQFEKAHIVPATAKCARTVARSERCRLVQKEELREPSGLHQRLAVPVTKREAACDPALAVIAADDSAVGVVEAPTVAVHETASGIGD
jgi:hypothetical protein